MSRFGHRSSVGVKGSAIRDFLRGNVAALAVLAVVVALAGPSAQANTGDPVIAGQTVQADNTTEVLTSFGYGLSAETTSSYDGDAGVSGFDAGGGPGVEGDSWLGNGVAGYAESATASGVYGENQFGGFGVAGRATQNGIAVLADNTYPGGTALRTTGRLEFQNRSGIAIVASGHKSIKVNLAGVTAESLVTATVQQTGGYFVRAAVPTAGSFTIYINKAPASPATVRVAYLVLN
jgi:hypothetical protein